MKRVFLDNAATTPVSPEIIEMMSNLMGSHFGNPSSIHSYGRESKTIVEQARKTIASLLNTSPGNIFFTSGGTEADNMAIKCAIHDHDIKHAITSKISHHAVLYPLEDFSNENIIDLSYIDIDNSGTISLDHLEKLLKDNNRTFVSIMHANNEIGSIQPIKEIGKICKDLNIWLHVDSAMAGPAAICPEFRFVNKGLTYANSYTFNPHKWMLTNFDCSIFYIQNKKYLLNALSIMPEYLKNKQSSTEQVTDLRDWGIPLGRRFRALKLWSVINYYGVKGIQDYIRNDMHITKKLKEWINKDDRFEIIAPTPLTLICFRLKGSNDENEKLLYNINKSGSMYLSHTKLDNKYTLRFSIGTSTSSLDHVKNSWKKIQEFAAKLKN